jgi:hypothetical protein
VDGPVNRFQADRLVTERLPEGHPRRSVWVVQVAIARSEREAMLDMDMHRPALWRVVNAGASNHVGHPTSYQLVPGMSVHTMLSEDDYPRRRAGFIDHHLWVTPYLPDERYAVGMYPTLSRPGEGLPRWTSANRSIADADIVLWYTMGMHHVARAEDWPVMPVAWSSFELRPFDFFDANPALRLPRRPPGVGHIVEGSVRRSGNRLRITAQLVDVRADRQRWSQTFDRAADYIFRVQDEIAAAIAGALRVRLARSDRTVSGTTDPEAYDLFLLGLYHWNQRTPEGLRVRGLAAARAGRAGSTRLRGRGVRLDRIAEGAASG